MGKIDALKTTIDANIRENGNQEITGEILNLVLNEMVSVVDDEKQDRLMNGVNIKTINGQNILGRGNITIEGGEGGGGGITEEKEVYIGEEAPTDDGAKLWIDPTGTPSQPSQPSAGVEVIDNLESDSATAALSANQGRVLKEMIGQGGASGGGSNVFVFPEEVLSDEYTADNPYIFSDEKFNELKVALQNPSSVYVAYQFSNGNITSLHGSLSFTPVGWTASFFTCVVMSGTTYLGAYVVRLDVVSGKLTAFNTFSMLTLS